MEDFDKYLDRLVENFYDTGKIEIVEDIETNVEDLDFDVETEEEIELEDEVENVGDDVSQEEKDSIEKEYGWLKNKEEVENKLSEKPYKGNRIERKTFKPMYILTNEIKKGNLSVQTQPKFVELLGKINKILNTDMKIHPVTYAKMTTLYKDRTINIYGLTDEQIKNWSVIKQKNKVATQQAPISEDEYQHRIENVVKYLNNTNVESLENTKEGLLRKFKLVGNNGKSAFKVLNDIFKDNVKINFYLNWVNHQAVKGRNKSFWKQHFVNYSKSVKNIISNTWKKENGKSQIRIKDFFGEIIKGNYCYIYNDDCKLDDSEIEILKNWKIEPVGGRKGKEVEEKEAEKGEEKKEKGNKYEKSFLELGFKKVSKGGLESRVHNLHIKGFSLVNKIKDPNEGEVEIAEFIINNVINFIEDTEDIIKFDLISDGDKKDVNGVDIIIPSNGKIEVKKNHFTDSYLSEFLASPVKDKEYGIITHEDYEKKYSRVIQIIYKWLSVDKVGMVVKNTIKSRLLKDLVGMIVANNVYIPLNDKDKNIEFYLSNVGHNNPEKHLRIAIRYHINLGNWKNFYRIGDGIWEITEGEKSEKGVMYPLTDDKLLKYKEKKIHPEDGNILDRIVENFFDTGNFDI